MNAKVISNKNEFKPYTLENIVNITFSDGHIVLTIADNDGLHTHHYSKDITIAIC